MSLVISEGGSVVEALERMGSPAVVDEPSVVPKPPLITADNTLERMGSMGTVGETSENLNPLGVPRRKFVPSSSRATADSAVGKQSASPKELPISINLDGVKQSASPKELPMVKSEICCKF